MFLRFSRFLPAGKGGSKIAEIRQMSGANIQISKSADKEPTAERQIQITGKHHPAVILNLANISSYFLAGLRIRILSMPNRKFFT